MLDGFKRKTEIQVKSQDGCIKKAAKYVVGAIIIYYAAKGCMGCTNDVGAMYRPETNIEQVQPKYDTIDDLTAKGADLYVRK